MTSFRTTPALLILLAALLLAAGCVSNPVLSNQSGAFTQISSSTQQSKAFYKTTIAQQNDSHADFIKMVSDIYNQGEVVEFYMVNPDSQSLTCGSVNPNYYVRYQMTNGSWRNVANGGTEQPMISYMKPGISTIKYHLDTTGWNPGNYRISFNCGGVYRDFILQTIPEI